MAYTSPEWNTEGSIEINPSQEGSMSSMSIFTDNPALDAWLKRDEVQAHLNWDYVSKDGIIQHPPFAFDENNPDTWVLLLQ